VYALREGVLASPCTSRAVRGILPTCRGGTGCWRGTQMHSSKKPVGFALTFIALIAVLAAGLFAQLGGGAGASASTNPDTLVYSQQNGAKGQYLQYVPGDGSKVTTQSVTGAGGCATPNTAAQPLLGFSAKNYPNGYTNSSVPAIVGAYNSRTGVCATPQ